MEAEVFCRVKRWLFSIAAVKLEPDVMMESSTEAMRSVRSYAVERYAAPPQLP